MRASALWVGITVFLLAVAALANEIGIGDIRLRPAEDGLVLDADFAFDLTPRLAEVLANGVPLYFRVDFELTRRRWYWLDERAAERQLHLRLSYHALSRHYRVSTGLLQRSFASL